MVPWLYIKRLLWERLLEKDKRECLDFWFKSSLYILSFPQVLNFIKSVVIAFFVVLDNLKTFFKKNKQTKKVQI
jgi:hypothetical protein